MKQTKGTPKILTADEGMKLTQADESTTLSDRIVTQRVYLAVNDAAERWKEITAAEGAEIMAAQAEAAKQRGKEPQP